VTVVVVAVIVAGCALDRGSVPVRSRDFSPHLPDHRILLFEEL
jgi:hypothetical protein